MGTLGRAAHCTVVGSLGEDLWLSVLFVAVYQWVNVVFATILYSTPAAGGCEGLALCVARRENAICESRRFCPSSVGHGVDRFLHDELLILAQACRLLT